MDIKYATYLQGFYIIACRTLSPYPEKYALFKRHWEEKNYIPLLLEEVA